MQTATDSIDLQTVRDLLAELKSGISSIAASEKDLIRNRAERMGTVRRESIQREETAAEKSNRTLLDLAAVRQVAIDAEHQRLANRNAWVHRAYHSAKSELANRAQGVKDRRIGQVQGSIMRNRQVRQEELKRASEAHEAFLELLASDRSTRRDLRKSALKTFRSYLPVVGKRFVGKINNPPDTDPANTPEKSRELLLGNMVNELA